MSESALLWTNSGSQVDGYISGSGWHYERYDITDLSGKDYASFKTAVETSSGDIVLI